MKVDVQSVLKASQGEICPQSEPEEDVITRVGPRLLRFKPREILTLGKG